MTQNELNYDENYNENNADVNIAKEKEIAEQNTQNFIESRDQFLKARKELLDLNIKQYLPNNQPNVTYLQFEHTVYLAKNYLDQISELKSYIVKIPDSLYMDITIRKLNIFTQTILQTIESTNKHIQSGDIPSADITFYFDHDITNSIINHLINVVFMLKSVKFQDNYEKLVRDAKTALGITADAGIGVYYKKLANPSIEILGAAFSTTFLWLIAIFALSAFLYNKSLSFDLDYYSSHLIFVKNFHGTSFDCTDTASDQIICIEKFFENIFSKNTTTYSYIASRITAMAAIIIALIFCIKNFNTNKRNQIVYEHMATVFQVSEIAELKFTNNEHLFLEKYSAFLFQSPEKGSSHDDEEGIPYKTAIEVSKLIGKSKEGG